MSLTRKRVEVVVYEPDPVLRNFLAGVKGELLNKGMRLIGNEDLAANSAYPGYAIVKMIFESD